MTPLVQGLESNIQTCSTCPGWAGTSAFCGCEDDFRISYSQSYTRVDSQSQHRTPPQVRHPQHCNTSEMTALLSCLETVLFRNADTCFACRHV